MTYIVITRKPHAVTAEPGCDDLIVVSSLPAATLEEAKREVIVQAGYAPQRRIPLALHQSLELLPESGGRIGPLPDGTGIEVVRVAQ